MRITCILLFLLLSLGIQAQQAQKVVFPRDFLGNWKGTLSWEVPGKPSRSFAMRLQVLPADSGRYIWQIRYGDDGSDNRPYLLVPADSSKGHWRIDERNGIVLDAWWIGQQLVSVFSVEGNSVITRYQLDTRGLQVEMISFPARATSTTGGKHNIPPVDNYSIQSIQHGVLQKMKP
ncbi:MAG TPA: hypothetical protein PKE63_11970 [Lacibacter sp.]|nr:hypothetical protein [Lacibacter sp.]HMO88132.1 hypothetical protein [Lacibacter sp.]HMP87986.1 hypothetical protein [Lacibacter sp.]